MLLTNRITPIYILKTSEASRIYSANTEVIPIYEIEAYTCNGYVAT